MVLMLYAVFSFSKQIVVKYLLHFLDLGAM